MKLTIGPLEVLALRCWLEGREAEDMRGDKCDQCGKQVLDFGGFIYDRIYCVPCWLARATQAERQAVKDTLRGMEEE